MAKKKTQRKKVTRKKTTRKKTTRKKSRPRGAIEDARSFADVVDRLCEMEEQSVEQVVSDICSYAAGVDSLSVDQLESHILGHYAAGRSLIRSTCQRSVLLGLSLRAARKKVPHGEWKDWLEIHGVPSYSSASRHIKVAEAFLAKSTKLGEFDPATAQLTFDGLEDQTVSGFLDEARPKVPAKPAKAPGKAPQAPSSSPQPPSEPAPPPPGSSPAEGTQGDMTPDRDTKPDNPPAELEEDTSPEWPELTREEAQRLDWPGPTYVRGHYAWDQLAEVHGWHDSQHPRLDFDGLLSRLMSAQSCAAFVAECPEDRTSSRGRRVADEIDRVLRKSLQLLLGQEGEFDLHRDDLDREAAKAAQAAKAEAEAENWAEADWNDEGEELGEGDAWGDE